MLESENSILLGIIANQSIKGTIYTYTGVLLGFITTAILLPRIYSTSQIGLLKVIVAYSTIISQFATLGINGVTIRLFPFFQNKEKNHHGFLPLLLTVGLIGFFVALTFLLIFRPILLNSGVEKSPLFEEYFFYLVVLVFFQLFYTLLDIYFSSLKNSVYGTFLKEVFQRGLIIIMIVLYVLDFLNFHQFVLSYIFCLSISTIVILYALYQRDHIGFKMDFYFIKSQFKEIVSVSMISIFNMAAILLIQNVDVIMVNNMVGVKAAGVYSICFFFGIIVSLPSRAIIKVANVASAEAWKIDDKKLLLDLYKKSCLTLFIIGAYLFGGILLNIDQIIQFIGNEYSEGKYVTIFIALGAWIDMTTGVNGSIIGTSKYFKLQSFLFIGIVILLIILNFILIQYIGLVGAAVSSAICLFVLNLIRYILLWYIFKIQPYNINFIKVLLYGVLAFFVARIAFDSDHIILNISVRSTIFTIIFALATYFLNISEDLNNKANEILLTIKKMLFSRLSSAKRE